MARTPVATDNFNRAALGTSDWQQVMTDRTVAIDSSIRITSSTAWGLGSTPAAVWIGAGTFENDQYSSLVIKTLDFLTADYNIGVIARCSTDQDATRDYYGAAVLCNSSGPAYGTTLFKVVNGTYTALHSADSNWAAEDRIEIECEGTTIRLCKNGTPLGGSFTQTDSSLSTGKPGVMISGGAGAISADDFEGGNMGAASIVPHAMAGYRMRTA